MGDFQEKIIGGTYEKGNQIISPEAVVSNTFLADYFRAAENTLSIIQEIIMVVVIANTLQ
ncbi:hypothetical protein [Hoylesella loescheii]|jgi:hypothetical protein|uniref:hypothetical protein n=1 Tax=Hoylesella loescheii TaxID=840 RepID=UPI00248D8E06|nr:hypothetical protein [Hoylesella loescheii]